MASRGLLFHATLELDDGRRQTIVSDESWRARLDRAHRPGQSKRWFLRALQEEFDARLHPYGWDAPGAKLDDAWVAAAALRCGSDQPPSCSNYPRQRFHGPGRSQPMRLAETADPGPQGDDRVRRGGWPSRAEWIGCATRPIGSSSACPTPIASSARRSPGASPTGGWSLPATATDRQGFWATFEFPGATGGLALLHDRCPGGHDCGGHDRRNRTPPDGPAWLDTHFFAWTRFVCREGVNHFESFDYESLRWLQLHVRNASRPVTIRDVGVRRRQFAWPNEPHIRCSEPALQRLFDASVNTLAQYAQETCVDGMGRERQQYSGDGGHQLHAIRYAFGETRLPARFLRTFSEGMTPQGYFLDCWPGYDRLARVMQKQIDGAYWGPLLDHGIGFNFDCWHHWMQTGDLESLREPYPRLLRFAAYLASIRDADGLLPVEHLGLPTVWIDHDRLSATAAQAVRLQPLRRRHAPSCPGADRPGLRRPAARPGGEQAGRRDPPGHGAAILERGAGPVRQQSALAAGGEVAPAVRPLPGDGHPLRPVPQRQHRRGGPRPGRHVLPRWACLIRATPTGATGPWRRRDMPR